MSTETATERVPDDVPEPEEKVQPTTIKTLEEMIDELLEKRSKIDLLFDKDYRVFNSDVDLLSGNIRKGLTKVLLEKEALLKDIGRVIDGFDSLISRDEQLEKQVSKIDQENIQRYTHLKKRIELQKDDSAEMEKLGQLLDEVENGFDFKLLDCFAVLFVGLFFCAQSF